MMNRRALLLGTGSLWAAPQPELTVLYGDRDVSLAASRVEAGDIWIKSADLPRINEFVIKPQGACREDICIPLPKALKRNGWINLSGFARKLKQSVVNEGSVWSFGELPLLRNGFLERELPRTLPLKTARARQCG